MAEAFIVWLALAGNMRNAVEYPFTPSAEQCERNLREADRFFLWANDLADNPPLGLVLSDEYRKAMVKDACNRTNVWDTLCMAKSPQYSWRYRLQLIGVARRSSSGEWNHGKGPTTIHRDYRAFYDAFVERK